MCLSMVFMWLTEGLEFPVHPQQISKFEKKNATISVNVYMFEFDDKELRVVPCHLTKMPRMKLQGYLLSVVGLKYQHL